MDKSLMNMSAWIVIAFYLPAAQSQEDNLHFSGTLVNEPCVLAAEDQLIQLDFKNVIDKDLYINGRTRSRSIDLHLKNCDLDVGKRMLSITFTGNESIEPAGLLVIQSPNVRGLLVGLETSGGKPLPLNKAHRMKELTTGDNLVNVNTYLQGEPQTLANRTLGLGDFEASLTFSLSYE